MPLAGVLMVVYQDGTYGLQQMVLLRQFIIAFMHRQVLADLPKKKVLTLIFGKTVIPPLFMHERLVSRAGVRGIGWFQLRVSTMLRTGAQGLSMHRDTPPG
jgi:hypothetical protein